MRGPLPQRVRIPRHPAPLAAASAGRPSPAAGGHHANQAVPRRHARRALASPSRLPSWAASPFDRPERHDQPAARHALDLAAGHRSRIRRPHRRDEAPPGSHLLAPPVQTSPLVRPDHHAQDVGVDHDRSTARLLPLPIITLAARPRTPAPPSSPASWPPAPRLAWPSPPPPPAPWPGAAPADLEASGHNEAASCEAASYSIVGSGRGIRTPDLRVMSPTSYRCSIPRRPSGPRLRSERCTMHPARSPRFQGCETGSGTCTQNTARARHSHRLRIAIHIRSKMCLIEGQALDH